MFYIQGCVDKAKEFYLRALRLEPENKLVAENLGKLIRTQKTVDTRNIVSRATPQDLNKMATDKQNGAVQRSNLSSIRKSEGMRNRPSDLSTNEFAISNTKRISRAAGAIAETILLQ